MKPTLPGTTIAPPEIVCAWCDKERGIVRMGNVSHGICNEHALIEFKNWKLTTPEIYS